MPKKNPGKLELTNEELKKIAYLNLMRLKTEKRKPRDKISELKGILHFGCDEAFGALAELLRDEWTALDHYARMDVLETLEKAPKMGCIEPLLDLLADFEDMEPKSRYLYQQMSKIIELLGKSGKKWLPVVVRKYTERSTALMREAAKSALAHSRPGATRTAGWFENGG